MNFDPNQLLAMVAVALLLGVLVGITTGIADRIFGGPNPETIATASLQSMRAENRLTVFAARYVSVVTSQVQRLGGLVNAQRTLILPGDVRYELDLAKLQPKDVTWDGSSKTLTVQIVIPFSMSHLMERPVSSPASADVIDQLGFAEIGMAFPIVTRRCRIAGWPSESDGAVPQTTDQFGGDRLESVLRS